MSANAEETGRLCGTESRKAGFFFIFWYIVILSNIDTKEKKNYYKIIKIRWGNSNDDYRKNERIIQKWGTG